MSVLLYVVHCFSTCYVDMARQYKSMQTQLEMRIQFLEAEVKRLTAQLGECGWVARPFTDVRTYMLSGTMWTYVCLWLQPFCSVLKWMCST